MASNAKNTNKNDLINYLYTEVKEVEMYAKYKNKNIIKERLELYHDFIIHLTYLLYNSYLGSEYIKSKEDMLSHYKWGYNKCCENFAKFTVDFSKHDILYNYLLTYFSNTLYNKKLNNDKLLKEYYDLSNEYWKIILTYDGVKTRIDLDTMFDCYDTFNSIFES